MRWYHRQGEKFSSLDLVDSNKRDFQGLADSHVGIEPHLPNIHAAGLRDGTGVPDLTEQRVLVLVKATGEALSVQASRIDLAARYGLSQRDLSLLDPWVPLPIPASFMVRKHAILANLGAVRLVISRCECIVVSSGRIAFDCFIFGEEPDISDILTKRMQHAAALHVPEHPMAGLPDATKGTMIDNSLPFELRMLDIALEEACKLLSIEIRGVVKSGKEKIKGLGEERASYRGSRIMEELKEIRSNMGALRARVQMLKKELEDVMEDDHDMLDMLLERRHVLSTHDIGMHTLPSMQLPPTSHAPPASPAPVPQLSPLKVRAADAEAHASATGGAAPDISRAATVPAAAGVAEVGAEAVSAVCDNTQRPASRDSVGEAALHMTATIADTHDAVHHAPGAQQPSGTPEAQRQAAQAVPQAPVPWFGTAEDLAAGFGSVLSPVQAGAEQWAARESAPHVKHATSKQPAGPSLAERPGFTSTFTSAYANSSQAQVPRLTGADRRTTSSHSLTLPAAQPDSGSGAAAAPHLADPSLQPAVSAPEKLPGTPGSPIHPDRVNIGDRIRQVSKVGQYGWGKEKKLKHGPMAAGHSHELQAGGSLRLSAEKRRKASPHRGFVQAMRSTLGGSRDEQREGGRATLSELSSAQSHASEPGHSSMKTVRSFTSTEAVRLALVQQEDPWEEAARAKYCGPVGGAALEGRPAGATMHRQHAVPPSRLGVQQPPGGSGRPLGAGISGAGESLAPESSAGMVRQGSDNSSVRGDLLEDLLSHMMDIKFQTAPRQQPAPINPHDIQEVENILEAYTLQLDYCLSQLDDLSGDIDEFWVDTQQELGRKRNALFALQILVNTVTMGFSFVSMVGAIFGMNLRSGVEMDDGWFNWVTIVSCGLAAAATVAIMMGLHLQGMLSLKKGPPDAMG